MEVLESICPAVREAGRSGDIKVVINDILPAHMECLKEGTAQYIVGQKDIYLDQSLFKHYTTLTILE